jgi:uncharacterized protein
MRIELINLEEGRGKFVHVYQPEDLDLEDERVRLGGPAAISGTIRHAGIQAFVDGQIETLVQVDCDRCLKPVQVEVTGDFSLEYITGGDYEESRNVELTDEVMSVSMFDGQAIDLDEIAKEQILLAVPTRSLCKPDCKGFCPTCGADKNAGECSCSEREIDPRWAALKDLSSGKS